MKAWKYFCWNRSPRSILEMFTVKQYGAASICFSLGNFSFLFPTLIPTSNKGRIHLHFHLQSFHLVQVLVDSWVGRATGYGLDDRMIGFDSRRGLGIFIFTTASRPVLGPSQPPIQWVPGALSAGVKRPGREADHPYPSSAEVRECVELTSTPPIRLHGMVLS
jgi:hypothetical protein